MARLCFALDLKDDPAIIAEYERWHEPGEVWPAIIDDIRADGYRDMQIWRTGDRLFMIAEVGDDQPIGERSATMTEIFNRWQSTMDGYQRPLPHAPAGVKWVPMARIFDLDLHPGSGDASSPGNRTG